MPHISVIVPNYNHVAFLPARISSILNQSFQDFELILLDDASTDSSRDVLEMYRHHPKVSHLVFSDNNSGSTFAQWLAGIKLAKGQYIWIAESDDLADSTFLEKHMAVFSAHPEVGISFSASSWINENDKVIHEPAHETALLKLGNELITGEFARGTFIYNASSCIFRRELVAESILQQAKKYRYCGDWLFWVELAKKTHVSRLPERLNKFRRHNNNVSFTSEAQGLQFSEGFEILNHIFGIQHFSFAERISTLLFWTRKLKLSKVSNKKQLLDFLPFPAKILYAFCSILVLLTAI